MLPDSCLVHAIHIHRIPEYFKSVALFLPGRIYNNWPDILVHNLEHDHNNEKSVEHFQIENDCIILLEQNI